MEADPKLPYIAMWWNPAKLYRKKAPKKGKGRENETRGKDRSPGKQTAQQRQGHSEEMELSMKEGCLFVLFVLMRSTEPG